MNTKENAVNDISLKEILAVIVRAGKKLIISMVVFAILFAAVGALNYYVLTENPDKEYEIAYAEYEVTKVQLAATIERTYSDAANQKDYNEKSQLMRIDPYSKKTTTMTFAITGIKLDEVTDSFGATEIPISYITSRIQAQYSVMWLGLDLQTVAEGTPYSNVPDQYLREVITMYISDGGILTLTIMGSDTEACEQMAKKLYEVMLESKEAVVKASYMHDFTVLNDTITKESIDLTLEKQQAESLAKLENYQMKIVQYEKELLELEAPSYYGGVKGIIVNFILGMVVGLLLMAIWVVCMYLIQGKVSGAKQMSSRYGLLHFGSMLDSCDLWTKLGYRVMNEKVWTDPEQAQSYIRENGINHLPADGSVVIASTLDNLSENTKNELVALLGAKGNKVSFVTDVSHNPAALTAITQCGAVVLAERAFASGNAEVKDMLATVKELDKPVCGFVLL